LKTTMSPVVRRSVKGSPHGGTRVIYARPIRQLGRDWARLRALPSRRGDRTTSRLVVLGAVQVVTINQATAWRLRSSLIDSIKMLEAGAGVSAIAREWGRHPDWERDRRDDPKAKAPA
jgi:hypothetical protein